MKRVMLGAAVMVMGAWIAVSPVAANASQEPSPVPASPEASQVPEGRDAPDAARVRAAVEEYIEQDTKLKGGFLLNDPVEQRVRSLTFDYVHDGVESAPNNQQVVCVDFLDQNKERLDIDFFLAPAPSGGVEVTRIEIHKVDDAERK